MTANSQSFAPVPDAQTASYQAFIGAFRKLWAGPIYRELRQQAGALPDQSPEAYDRYEARLAQLPIHQLFGWLEHNLQLMKYRGAHGVVPMVEGQRQALEQALLQPVPDGMLTLSEDMALPDYYKLTDFHHHPGGLREDPLAGIVYRTSAGAAGGVVGRAGLHRLFANHVTRDRGFDRVLDIGCGFGRSTLAFAGTGSDTRAVGIDLSAGCLRLAAHLGAEIAGKDRVRYLQADGASVPQEDAGFDLVTSTMLLHELSADAIRDMTAEAFRLLQPGGEVAHLDFLPPDDNFLRALFLGHSDRNAEPHMRDLAAIDLPTEFQKAGFADISITPFDETGGETGDGWRLPWVVIRARKPQ
ncbi:ubiquinone/menaquinone biosynthesis C-methyltransferase UbiE (plasmid) [Antarctobacter heliothermus]|uniref:Ubiquinone/menaquinone biosynthesis C-methyltransferase UbiE n=1 Tax=Antarctobacter heliothermus TaxID=74033 RepID=A0A222EC04_9RHOB|nr:class I SAM-dependent methyltransferase [Antarctobacter heliothermus]ASP23717.1 ubiquinone/menaquinone biosynthesis C-methyltransferase UbiE [Antarctobacter heliothermus]